MGGGISQHELAAAVTAAGGLGTVGMMHADAVESQIRQVRDRTDKPVATNVLLPLARRRDFEVAAAADLVVTFWGRPRRIADKPWVHQCGSLEEALAAHAAGADGVIAQGVEAGGAGRGRERGGVRGGGGRAGGGSRRLLCWSASCRRCRRATRC